MKLVVQIPCYNEEETLPQVLRTIPQRIEGVDEVEVLVIDDGSTDRTSAVARSLGVHHLIRHTRNKGLARSFHDGVKYCLRVGADIVVNTDGDNQYPQERIGDLIAPILEGRADIVVADRQSWQVEHFSRAKKILQAIGSYVVNRAAGTDLPDAASGFRAYSRDSLFRLNVVTKFSYAMETIIQAGNKGMAVTSIPITTNPRTRESRLFRSIHEHVIKSAQAIIRSYIMFRPYVVFASLGVILGVLGLLPFVRYLVLLLRDTPGDHIQSLLLGAILTMGALISFALGVLSDLIRTNRSLIEHTLEEVREIKHGRHNRDAGRGGEADAEELTR